MLHRDDVANYGAVEEGKGDTQKASNPDSEIKHEHSSSYVFSFINNLAKWATVSVPEQPVLHPAIPQLKRIITQVQRDSLWRQNAVASEKILIQILNTLSPNNYADVSPEAKKEIINILQPPLTRGIFSTEAATIIKDHITAMNATSAQNSLLKKGGEESALSYLSFP